MDHDEQVREVYDGCYRRLVAQLFVVCGDLNEAEDAVQEAFVRAIAGHLVHLRPALTPSAQSPPP